jgi:hypothetical protein
MEWPLAVERKWKGAGRSQFELLSLTQARKGRRALRPHRSNRHDGHRLPGLMRLWSSVLQNRHALGRGPTRRRRLSAVRSLTVVAPAGRRFMSRDRRESRLLEMT